MDIPAQIPPLITAVIALFWGFFVLRRNRCSVVHVTFALLCFFTFWWQFCWYFLFRAPDPETAFLIARFGYTGIIFIPVTFFHFVVSFLEANKKEQFFIRSFYILSVLFVVSLWTTNAYIGGAYINSWGYYPKAASLHLLHLVLLLIITFKMLHLLLAHIRKVKASPNKYNQTKYILLAIVFYFLSSIDFLDNYGWSIYPFGYVFVLACLFIFAYAMARYRLLDIRIAISRAGLFLFVYAVVLGLPFWLGYTYGFDGAVLLTGMLLATVGPLIYGILQKKTENILLAEQRRYQHVLLQASHGMVRVHNLERLLKLVVRIIKRTVKIQFVAVYISTPGKHQFAMRAVQGIDRSGIPSSLADDSPLLRYLHNHREPFLFDEADGPVRSSLGQKADTVLIVPSYIQDRLLGFLLLGRKLSGHAYSVDDIGVFQTLANQAALSIENSLFVEEAKQTQERLFNAEKLASIGGMADGLAHQIKNRLYEFSIVSQNMEYDIDDVKKLIPDVIEQNMQLRDKIDFIAKGATLMIDNVHRTNLIIKGILDFARTEQNETSFSRFPVRDIIDPAAHLVKIKHQLAALPLHVELPEDGTIYGIKGQLQECLYNCMDNAYEAISEKLEYRLSQDEKKSFTPQITITLSHQETHDVIEIADNGIGIKEEDRPKLFTAFFTTKPSSKSGSGIGNYVGKRMVEEHHQGKMYFTSRYMEGTSLFISLPQK